MPGIHRGTNRTQRPGSGGAGRGVQPKRVGVRGYRAPREELLEKLRSCIHPHQNRSSLGSSAGRSWNWPGISVSVPTKAWPSTIRLIHVIVTAAEAMGMAKKKLPGHFCKVCGMWKSNESFSGRGHAAHICKACSRLSPARQAEEMTLRRLENLPLRRLSESEMTWLKNRTHDHRPEVKSLACMVYAQRFPR